MRNFKKILSLVLAMAMMLSVMVVGAGAAFKDEGDFSEEYVTAAEALTNLGVLWGYEDGSFQPQDSITRAETAALIYRMTTGDVTDANKGNYTNMTNGFTDVKSADWFAGYVNFCANAQYVAGYGDGKFGPQDKVTGYQTLAMILRAVGFDKADEFTGADWEVKTASFAQKLGILDNVKGSEKLGEPASRELVAELLFQAMATVDLVHYAPFFGYVDVKGETTLGNKQFDLAEVEGFVYANEEANLETSNAVNALEDGKTWIKTDAGMEKLNLTTGTDIIGEQVSVWVAGDDAVSTPISLADTTTEWSNTTWKFLDKDALKDWDEATDNGTLFYNNYDYNKNGTCWDGKGVYIKAIDNDGDGTYEFVLAEKQTLDVVKYIKNDGNIIFYGTAPCACDQFAYEGIAREDVVLTIEFDGNLYINEAEYITGQMSKYVEEHGVADDYATINGEEYTQSDIAFASNGVVTEFVDIAQTFNQNYNGTTYNYYLDSYGNIKAYAKADELATEYALLLDFDWYKSGAFAGDLWVKYLTVDGNVETAVVSEEDSKDFDVRYDDGDVVLYRLNKADQFVLVYDEDDQDPIKKLDQWVSVDSNDLVNINGTKCAPTEDFVVFYYNEDFGDVYYGVLTGDAALADLAATSEKWAEQVDYAGTSNHNGIGAVSMLNIDGRINPTSEYCYVLNTIKDEVRLDGSDVLYVYDAINENGDPIEVVLKNDRLPAGPAKVFKYEQYSENYLDGVVTYNLLKQGFDLEISDIHPYTAGKFIVDGNTNKIFDNVKFINVDEDYGTVGAEVTLHDEFCTKALVVVDGTDALAVFVTDGPDGDDWCE